MRILVLLCVWCTYSHQRIDGSTSAQGDTGLRKRNLVDGFSCCVDDWETMLCIWDLDQSLISNDSITVRLKWAIMDRLSYCRHQNKTSCLWKSDDGYDTYKTGLNYYMEINVTTEGEETVLEIQNFTVNTSKLVKPAPVDSLTMVGRNQTCLSLQWKHNKSYRNMLYTLHVKQGSNLQIYNYTDTTSATTCGLHPGLLYTLEVACIPIPYGFREPHGFYSQWTSVNARTQEDVPSGVPGVEISSFRYHRCSSQTSDCEVTIYWQPVPEMECNGEITQYQVTQVDTESGQMEEFEVEGSDTSLDLGVKKVRQYLIKLKARTRVGYTEHYASMLIPAYQYNLPPPTNILVEAKGSVLHVSWDPPELSQNSPEGQILGYTLYYCTDSKFTNKCMDPVQWLHLPNNQTSFQWRVPDGELDNKRIGISVEMETSSHTISSGLLWNQCVYRQKELLPPRNVRFSHKQPDNGLQVVWDKFVCADNPVYVSHFVLSYCITKSHAECADPPLQVKVSNKDVSHVIPGLSAGVKYRVTLRAVSRMEDGPESDPIFKEVTKAPGYVWVLVLVVVLALVLTVLVVCVCYWKVRKVTRRGFYLPVTMPEFPLSQITTSNGQHETHPNDVVDDSNNNSTKKDVCALSETSLSCMEHRNQNSPSESKAKSCMKLHGEEGNSSDASEILSSEGNKSVETYSKVDLPSVCTNADTTSVSLSDQDCLISRQNYSSEMEVQLGFMLAPCPFPFQVPQTQLPPLPTLSPHIQPPIPNIQPPTFPTQIRMPQTQSPTSQSQLPTPDIHSPTHNTHSLTLPTLSPTSQSQLPTPDIHSPTHNTHSLTLPTQSPTSSTRSPTPYIQLPTPQTQSPTPNASSPTPHSQLPAIKNQPPISSTQSPTPHTPSSTPNTQSPTPHTPSSTPNTQSPMPPTQSHTPRTDTSDPLSLAHLPTGPPSQPQTPPAVTRAHLSTPFILPSHSQAPHNAITHLLLNPAPSFPSSPWSQAPTAIATRLPPRCPPATPLQSCTPSQAPCAGYVSPEALNLWQAKNHNE